MDVYVRDLKYLLPDGRTAIVMQDGDVWRPYAMRDGEHARVMRWAGVGTYATPLEAQNALHGYLINRFDNFAGVRFSACGMTFGSTMYYKLIMGAVTVQELLVMGSGAMMAMDVTAGDVPAGDALDGYRIAGIDLAGVVPDGGAAGDEHTPIVERGEMAVKAGAGWLAHSCTDCGMLSACPMMRRGALTDLTQAHENPGGCWYWRPGYVRLDAGHGCKTCLHAICDGVNSSDRVFCKVLSGWAACDTDGAVRRWGTCESAMACTHWMEKVETDESADGLVDGIAAGRASGDAVEVVEMAGLNAPVPPDGSADAGAVGLTVPAVHDVGDADRERLAVLTAEVRMLNQQTIMSIYGIGQRLNEIKELTAHGDFDAYIQQNFGYSHDTANRFMRIAREYGEDTLPKALPVSKVYELLSLPAEDRTAFVGAHKVEDLTVRQLREEISQVKADAAAKARELRDALEGKQADLSALNDEIDRQRQAYTASRKLLTSQVDTAHRLAEDAIRQRDAALDELESRPVPETLTVEVTKEVPPSDYEALKSDNADMAEELRQARERLAELQEGTEGRVNGLRKRLTASFDSMVDSMQTISRTLPDEIQLGRDPEFMVVYIENLVEYIKEHADSVRH